VRGVEVRGAELWVSTADGAAVIGPVAVALSQVAPVRNLTLRTTTLDDVFLELTGNHIRLADHDLADRDLVEVPA
jgi:ABC-2 type transport system ATP-binding protein